MGDTDTNGFRRGRTTRIATLVAVVAAIAAGSFAGAYAIRARGDDSTPHGDSLSTGTPQARTDSEATPAAGADASEPPPVPTATPIPRPPPTSTLSVPWVGVNNWSLAASSDVHDDCGGASQLVLDSKMFRWKAMGVDVVRFAAYQSFGIDANHNRNWTAFDRVFAAAQKYGVHLIPVLGNNYTDCDYWGAYPGAQGKDAGTPVECGGSGNWYDVGYKAPYNGYVTGYRQWVADFVARYSRHPMLAAWELVNEPWGSCIHRFFGDVIGVVRANDPVTPSSLGSGGQGEAWSKGDGYAHETALADWATAHVYGTAEMDPTTQCPGKNCLYSDIADAGALGKPFYVGEAGIDDRTNCDTPQRADEYRARMRAAFDAGASGYVLWAYNERSPAGQFGLDFGPDSPIMRLFAEF